MNKKEKIIMLISVISLIIIIGVIIFLNVNNQEEENYFKELTFNEVMDKLDNKETFILVLSQTTCSHCALYKPKIESVAYDYKLYIYYLEVDLISDTQREELLKIIHYDGTPTTVFFTEGEEKTAATRINGDASIEKITKKLKTNDFIDE